MTAYTESAVTLSHLHHADGSATFSQNGYTVVGAVNGPIEVQRRDELPEEATMDVIIRPATGVGGIRERYLESILQSTLRQIVLIHNFPRTLIQIILQVTSTPQNESNLTILPALIQTSVLTLLSAAVPLAVMITSTLVVFIDDGRGKEIIENPTISEIERAISVHVLAFTSHGELLVVKSEGEFTIDDWDQVFEKAQCICCSTEVTADVGAMLDKGREESKGGLSGFLRSTLRENVASDLWWKK